MDFGRSERRYWQFVKWDFRTTSSWAALSSTSKCLNNDTYRAQATHQACWRFFVPLCRRKWTRFRLIQLLNWLEKTQQNGAGDTNIFGHQHFADKQNVFVVPSAWNLIKANSSTNRILCPDNVARLNDMSADDKKCIEKQLNKNDTREIFVYEATAKSKTTVKTRKC